MTDTTYNGWTNYATWRVNLEMFDGMAPGDVTGQRDIEAHDLSKALQEYAELIMVDRAAGLALDCALAFMSDVNWYEIAQHMIEAYQEA
jgi:hypothetical protein